jgi:hypothetical protein
MKKLYLLSILVLLTAYSANSQKVVAEKAFTIDAGGYTWFTFDFPEDANIKGKFRAQGGSRNDIEVYLMDDDSLENWRNGNSFRYYYFSGRVTVDNFNLRLRKGRYNLVFSNRWSILTPKAVTLWFYE